jgi:DNA-binding GntR family transcriptional regulator
MAIELKKYNMEESAYRAIIRMILENQFRPGDFLLESDLAERLSYSRTPVCLALNRLVAEGFLEKRRKKGCLIPIPDPKDARHVFLARKLIESQTASLAAAHATPQELGELERVLVHQDLFVGSGSKEIFSTTNEAFHLGIARMARNPYLERYCRHCFWHSNTYIFYFDAFYRDWQECLPVLNTPSHHRRILDAIARHETEEAGRLMGEHIQTTYEGLLVRL